MLPLRKGPTLRVPGNKCLLIILYTSVAKTPLLRAPGLWNIDSLQLRFRSLLAMQKGYLLHSRI